MLILRYEPDLEIVLVASDFVRVKNEARKLSSVRLVGERPLRGSGLVVCNQPPERFERDNSDTLETVHRSAQVHLRRFRGATAGNEDSA
jgi:hypothetical protein